MEESSKAVNEIEGDGQSSLQNADTILKLVQTIAILAAGLWALFEYTSYQSKIRPLLLQEQQLSTKQAELEVKLDSAIRAIDLAYEKQARLKADLTVDVQKTPQGPSGEFRQVDISFSAKNESRETQELTYVVVDVFPGDLSEPNADSDFYRLNSPPSLDYPSEEGVVKWSRIGGYAHVYPGVDAEELQPLNGLEHKVDTGGGGTAEINAGESSGFSHKFFVRLRTGDMLGIVVNVGLNRGAKPVDRKFYKFWEQIQAESSGKVRQRMTRSGTGP